MAKAAQERWGLIFIGLAREASRWKRFPEKVVPSDEPMVSPCEASDHPVSHSAQYSHWTKKPRQCTDAIHWRHVRSSGAEDFTLGAVLFDLNITAGWTAESSIKVSVHPVLKQLSWRVSVWFKCNRRMNRWSRRRIVRCLSAEPWPKL
jgi:hypothetical protein